MEKMWAGRTDGKLNEIADAFNSSLQTDKRMFEQDIKGSLAHAEMLANTGIIEQSDFNELKLGLESILADIKNGKLLIENAEDIHMFVESELTKRVGVVGKKLHTARSRNDQVALDIRMYLRDETAEIISLLKELIVAVADKAEENKDSVATAYTHLQHAQPVAFGHHLLSYAFMLLRDKGRLEDAVKRMNFSPLGSCAACGTTFPIDRYFTAEKLGFDGITLNSIDGVSDRDFCVELMSAFSLLMMHLSRFCEELILWSSSEFATVELDDAFTTGSSIMPQKKNSDMAELVRGKTGRVYGNLFAMLTVLKGLPLAYNKDMQEDKELVFDSIDTVKMCLSVFTPMIASMKVKKDRLSENAKEGFINATDLADYLAKHGVPFRSAYKTVGEIVAYCIKKGVALEELPIDEYKKFSDVFEEDLYHEINLKTCIEKRISAGGTGSESVKYQLEFVRQAIL